MSIAAVLLVCVASFNATPEVGVPVSVHFWAAEAVNEQRDAKHFDRPLVPAKEALEPLPYNTFRSVNTGFQAIRGSEEAVFKINSRYELRVRATCPGPGQQIKLDLKVLLHTPGAEKGPVTALETRVNTVSGKQLAVRGLKLESGNDLVIVLGAST